MDDPFELRKDNRVLARLSGASKLGQFTAYEQMEVTDAGRRRGYFNLRTGEIVHTPQSKLQKKDRVQLPLRQGLLYRILIGETTTGKTKKSETQKNVLCLSFVEKKSRYSKTVTDPLGLYSDSRHEIGIWAYEGCEPEWGILGPCTHAWDPSDFCFVITSPRCTSPYHWIWDLREHIGDALDDEAMEYYPDDDRAYSFTENFCRDNCGAAIPQEYVEPDECAFALMDSAFAKYSCPSPNTAVGQAKRAMTAEKHAPITAPRCARRHPAHTATLRAVHSPTQPRASPNCKETSPCPFCSTRVLCCALAVSESARHRLRHLHHAHPRPRPQKRRRATGLQNSRAATRRKVRQRRLGAVQTSVRRRRSTSVCMIPSHPRPRYRRRSLTWTREIVCVYLRSEGAVPSRCQ
jgi:hypothetical protein